MAAVTEPRRKAAPSFQTRLLIDGQFRDSISGKTFATVNPATEEVIAQVAEGEADDIDLAVKAARKAFECGPWRKLDARPRPASDSYSPNATMSVHLECSRVRAVRSLGCCRPPHGCVALRCVLQQVADLGEQLFLLGRSRGGLGFFLLEMHDPAQKLHDEKEEGRGNDQEVDDVSEEQTVRNVLTVDPEHPVFVALVAREDNADNRHDNVIDKRFDDVAEGAADDHAHGQVDHIPLERELPELVEEGECLLGGIQVFQVHGRSYRFVSQQITGPATQARFPWAAA